MIRQRHVPLLCGSCQGPLSRQELTCWRCGARVGRSRSSRRGGSSRRQRTRRGPTEGCAQRARRRRPGRSGAAPRGGEPSRSRPTRPRGTQPRGGLARRRANVPRPRQPHQTNDAGAGCHDRCRRRRLRPAPPAPEDYGAASNGTRQAVTAASPRPGRRGRRHEALGHPPARGAVPAHPRGPCGLRYGHEHALGEVDEAAGVAPLVVVPGDDLDLRAAGHERRAGVEDGGVGGLHDVGGDERLLAVRRRCRSAIRGRRAPRMARLTAWAEVSCSSSTVRSTSEPVAAARGPRSLAGGRRARGSRRRSPWRRRWRSARG